MKNCCRLSKKQLEDKGLWQDIFNTEKKEWFFNTMDLIRDRFHVLTDFISRGRAYFSEDYPMEQGSLEKNILTYPDLETQLPALAGKIQVLDEYNAQTVEKAIRDFMGEHKIKAKVLINAIRVVLTGQSAGSDFIKSLICLGQNTVVDRLNKTPSYF